MSCMAQMRSAAESLESFPILSTMDGGLAIFCWEKYWHRSAKRVVSSANSFCSAGNEIQPFLSLVAVLNRTQLAAWLELVKGSGFSLRPFLFFVFEHLFGNSSLILVAELRPFQTAVPLLLFLETPV